MSEALDLPPAYQRVKPIERGRCRPGEVAALDSEALRKLYEHRRNTVAAHQSSIDFALNQVGSDQAIVRMMAGVDFGDLGSMTPRQAAYAEATLLHLDGFGEDHAIGVWNHVRGVPFALEAFAGYCSSKPGNRSRLLDFMAPARQLLDLVRSAPDEIHAEAMAVAARLRAQNGTGSGFVRTLTAFLFSERSDQDGTGSQFVRALTTFLFPERSDWFTADLGAAGLGMLPATGLVPSVVTAEQAAIVGKLVQDGPKWTWDGDEAVELTFLTIAGAQALPLLLAWHDGRPDRDKQLSEPRKKALELISRVPGDAAMRALAERDDGRPERLAYLHSAAERFPDSALRVLSAMAPAQASIQVIAAVVAADPDRARAMLPELGKEARERVAAVIEQNSVDIVAASQIPDITDIPGILIRPPWSDPGAKRPKPVVLDGLTSSPDVDVVWLPGEREQWLGRGASGWEPRQGWPAIAEQIAEWRGQPEKADDPMTPVALYFAAYAPPELVGPLLEDGWRPPLRRADDRARAFVARYEVRALPTVLAISGLPGVRARLLQPFVSAELAASLVEGMTRRRSLARGAALGWLRRHPEAAVRHLLPTALGRAGLPRRNAEAALRWLAAEGTDVVGLAGATHGAAAGVALKELMADGALGTFPRTMPETPAWARPSVLPTIRLQDGTAALPPRAVRTVVEMLQISKPEAPYPGLEIVKELCDGSSLGEFVFALFQNWQESGSPDRHHWAVDAMGQLGDDGTVARLEPLIGPWTTDRHYTLVDDTLTVLGMIGGDRALAVLHAVVQKGRRKAVRRRAEGRFQDVAQSLDLTADELADRVVPTLGLSAEGTLRLDYGPRSFDVGFDEVLRPRITDEAGKVLARMPRPVKTDDQELAKAAYQQFTELKKAAQTVATDQIQRLEKAMFTRRRWEPDGFAAHLVAHPLLRHLVRRLVWGVYAADGSVIGSFRVAEDLSYADAHDAHYEIPEGATLGVAHPVELGPVVDRWCELFADYEILQPLDQLGRPALGLTQDELAGRTLTRFERVVLNPAQVAALEPRGWYCGPVGDPPVWPRFLRPLGDDRYVILDISPGLRGGVASGSGYQNVQRVWLSVAAEDASFELHSVPLSELGAAQASEILWDLAEVSAR
ncbi:DUF4132 domain-containing protein [Catenulispora sp. NL8]|uniref:DUF4132 domain-containing protein n=1 Tax=Catenulispora pinistramenti TaxID=2705254 RepID=A0ABS5L3P7_9ACTN|nr:DUF4132 domain-containing protein [Catenulispora pinistramenti]MBS2552735.1 DUF4132 domain-containing protein [Catenulispora pinistramenti]